VQFSYRSVKSTATHQEGFRAQGRPLASEGHDALLKMHRRNTNGIHQSSPILLRNRLNRPFDRKDTYKVPYSDSSSYSVVYRHGRFQLLDHPIFGQVLFVSNHGDWSRHVIHWPCLFWNDFTPIYLLVFFYSQVDQTLSLQNQHLK
jgi:hypothetical protein